MADKSYRIPITKEQKSVLAKMLDDVPTRKTVQYDWTSEAGRSFIKAVRIVQINGVPMPWIAEALDVSAGALQNAISYWERPTPSRSAKDKRRRLPLRKATLGDE